jgi:hypothetical protein
MCYTKYIILIKDMNKKVSENIVKWDLVVKVLLSEIQ